MFRIGRDSEWADLYVEGNDLVSRRHAELVRRGDEIYLKDLGSKNHTYLNGIMIPREVEILVKDGSEIRLANEVLMLNR